MEAAILSPGDTRHTCWTWNPGSDTCVVALHGFTGRGSDFALCASMIPEWTWTAIDIVGRTGNGEPAVLPVKDLAALVALHAEGIPAPRRLLLGYSMGGRLALATLLHRPDLFAGVILVGATAGIDDPEARRQRQASDAALALRARADGAAAFVAAWQAHPLVRTQQRIPAPWRGHILDSRRTHTPEGLAQCLERYGQGTLPSLWPQLEGLRVPLLAVAGEQDHRYHEPVRRFGTLPRATTQIIPGAGHATHLEAPEAFASTARSWAGEGKL